MTSLHKVIEVFTEVSDATTMKRLFEEVFTPAEIQDVALRWRLMTMLHDGISQRQIASELKISLCKITRGSKVLKRRNSVSKKILDFTKGANHASREKTRKPA